MKAVLHGRTDDEAAIYTTAATPCRRMPVADHRTSASERIDPMMPRPGTLGYKHDGGCRRTRTHRDNTAPCLSKRPTPLRVIRTPGTSAIIEAEPLD
jgi:hypothetical protein